MFSDIWRDVGDFLVSNLLELFHNTDIFLREWIKEMIGQLAESIVQVHFSFSCPW